MPKFLTFNFNPTI